MFISSLPTVSVMVVVVASHGLVLIRAPRPAEEQLRQASLEREAPNAALRLVMGTSADIDYAFPGSAPGSESGPSLEVHPDADFDLK
jgi:hypothetical protein